VEPAHQVFRIERDDPVPTGEGVKIPWESLMKARPGDSVAIVQRGTQNERYGEVEALIEDDDGNRFVAVRFRTS
jgi:hypothetical protein